jgi:hypothetical protein
VSKIETGLGIFSIESEARMEGHWKGKGYFSLRKYLGCKINVIRKENSRNI